MYVYQEHAGSRGAQERASDTLELELQGAVGHHVVLGMQPRPPGRTATALTAGPLF